MRDELLWETAEKIVLEIKKKTMGGTVIIDYVRIIVLSLRRKG